MTAMMKHVMGMGMMRVRVMLTMMIRARSRGRWRLGWRQTCFQTWPSRLDLGVQELPRHLVAARSNWRTEGRELHYPRSQYHDMAMYVVGSL